MTSRSPLLIRRGLCVLGGGALLLSGMGCLSVPVHVTPQVQGAGGPSTLADTTMIKPGRTTRSDVLHDWAWCDEHADTDRLFLGSVKRSTSKRVETLGPIYAGSGREWDNVVFFVEFDDQGIVTKSYFVRSHDRLAALVSWVHRTNPPPLDLSKPIEISAEIETGSYLHKEWAKNGVLVLASGGLEMRSRDDHGDAPVHFDLQQIQGIRTDYWSGQHLTIHGTPGWSNVNLALESRAALILVRYLKQTRESALPK